MKNKKLFYQCILLCVLLISSIGMYMSYSQIKKHSYMTNTSMNNIIDYCVSKSKRYYIPIDLELKKQNNENTDPVQYLDIQEKDTLSQNDLENIENNYRNAINDNILNLLSNKNISYQAINTKNNQTISDTEDDLSSLYTNKDLQKKYSFYYQITFDENRNYKINFLKNNNQEIIDNIHSNISDLTTFDTKYDYDIEYTSRQKLPSNLTITFAVPQDIVANTDLAYYISNSQMSDYIRFSIPYILLGILICSLATLITPLQILESNRVLHFLVRIKFLFLTMIWPTITFSMSMFTPYMLKTTDPQFRNILSKIGIESWQPVLTPVLNIIYWFVYFLLFVLSIYWLKYIIHKGLKRYIKEDTCIGWVVTNGYRLLNKVSSFDFDDPINKSVFKIVGVNFIIMFIINFLFGFGIIVTIIYSIVLFLIFKKKFNEINNDYQKLLQYTKKLSKGHFDIEIDEDIGVFNPLKEEFSHIKNGFEKAVNEEVKSQKMKTELISNVSHDLKTPLTSIITYVDLLKQEDISYENKSHYLQILERNALRLKNLIDDLFEVSKANSGDIHLDFVDIDIQALIKQALLECQDKLDEKNLDIRFNVCDSKIICHLDSSKTYRIFENLLINISKYALSATRVYIDVEDNEYEVKITFKNISEAEMNFNEQDIVERFVQGDKSRHTGGSGLGLAIVKSFTEIQKGTFHVEIDGDLFKSVLTFKK